MGKTARRGTAAGAIALAGALAFSTAAAANTDGDPIDVDNDAQEVAELDGPTQYRFADQDRVGTALQAAQQTNLPWGEDVIIANADVFADALTATTLADVLDAPVLLNAPGTDGLRGDVYAYAASNFDTVHLVGGTDVFGSGVVDQLNSGDAGVVTVERHAGVNRYDTAVALADETIARATEEGAYETINVFLASGTDYPDALAAGAAAADMDGVVLLTNGSDRLTASTYEAITEHYGESLIDSIISVGGPAAAAAAAGHQGDPIETNFDHVGDDRYETAVEVAENYLEDATNFVVASGQGFPDAVVGGAYAANVDGALLLTRPDQLTNATADYFESIRLDVSNVFVFGGPDSIQPSVSVEIAELDWLY